MYAECLLIAHAETDADKKMIQIKKQEKLTSLIEVQQSPRFRNQLQFNQKYIDNELLPESRKSNEALKKGVSSKDIEIVIVSPQTAALQTCLDLFGDKDGVQIYVQPLLHPRINSAALIPTNNEELLKKFKKEPHLQQIHQNKQWFLAFGAQENQASTSASPQEHCLQLIRKNGDFERQFLFQERNKRMRKKLFDYIRKSKKTLALISHPLMLQSLTATGWHQDGTPINTLKFDYGEVRTEHVWIEGVVAQAEEKHIPFCS